MVYLDPPLKVIQNKKNTGLVSIIIPVYNRESLIGETLDSIAKQSYKNWECIIVDDGSTDNTQKIVSLYSHQDNRIRFFNRPSIIKSGGAGARNFGFDIAEGEYIQFLDSDDLLHPLKLEIQINSLENNKLANYCVCENVVFKDNPSFAMRSWFNSKSDSNERLHDYVIKKLGIQTASPIFRKNFLEKIKNESILFEPDLRQSQEWELYCRIIEKDPNYIYIPDVLLFIRDNPQSITYELLNSNSEAILSQIQALKSVQNYLKKKNKLTQDLNTFFINSGITILKKIINKGLSRSLRIACNNYILGCLPNNLSGKVYKIRYELGKFLWSCIGRGHFLLKY